MFRRVESSRREGVLAGIAGSGPDRLAEVRLTTNLNHRSE
jgi:hypothetical protein